MTDTPSSVASATANGSDHETDTQRQARLRREKRQKKMAEQGEDRLARIKALNGGIAPPEEVLGGPSASQDRLETDARDSPSPSLKNRTFPSQNEEPVGMSRLQMQSDPQIPQGAENDPMVKMMQQMMGLMNPDGGSGNTDAGSPDASAFMASMLNGDHAKESAKVPAHSLAFLWRPAHGLFAFILALYICLTSAFDGSKLSRSQSAFSSHAESGSGPRFFAIFTAVELVLQSTRYLLEKGQLQGTGMLATIANSGVIPEPYANYVRITGRYAAIARTIFCDVMVVIFVMGLLAFWNGSATAA